LTYLTIKSCDYPIESLDIPSLKILKLPNFNKPFNKLNLPNLNELIFGYKFNQELNDENINVDEITIIVGKKFKEENFKMTNTLF